MLEILGLRRSGAVVAEDATGSFRDGAWGFSTPKGDTPKEQRLSMNSLYTQHLIAAFFSVLQVTSTPDFAEDRLIKFMDTPQNVIICHQNGNLQKTALISMP